MTLFPRRSSARRVRRAQLAVETLEARTLMAGSIVAAATHGLTQPKPAQSPVAHTVKAPVLTPDGIQRAADTIALLVKLHDANDDFPADRETDGFKDSLLPPGDLPGQLRDALEKDGVSARDLDRLFGPADAGPSSLLLATVFSSHDQSQDWLSQLPFLSVTAKGDVLGGAYATDPRTAAEAGTGDAKVVKQTLPDANGDVHIQYDNGTEVVVHKDNSVEFHYDDGSADYVGSGKDPAVTRVEPDGSYQTDLPGGGIITGSLKTGLHATWGRGEYEGSPGWVGTVLDAQNNLLGYKFVSDATGMVWDIGINGQRRVEIPPRPQNSKMPNPEGDDGHAVPAAIPVGARGTELDLDYRHQPTEADVAKVAGRTAAGRQSTVNPNPDAPSFLDGAGLPHFGPIDYDMPVHNGNVHPGAKPTIVLPPGGAGPKVNGVSSLATAVVNSLGNPTQATAPVAGRDGVGAAPGR
jgi:hypothetical protein